MTTARSAKSRPRPEDRCGVEQDLRALQWLEPAGEQRHAGIFETQPSPQPGAVVLGEEARVDAGLGNADAVSGRAIQADEVFGLGRARGDEAVSLGGELTLGLSAERIQRQAGACLGQRQGVKRLHPRNVPRLSKLPAHQAAVPVMAVDGPIGATFRRRVTDGRAGEVVEQRPDILLAEWLRRPHGEANQPAQRRDQLLVGAGSVATHEHVGGYASKRESLAQPADGEVHPAVLAAAQIRQRRGVHGDDGDRPRAGLEHGLKCTHRPLDESAGTRRILDGHI